MSKQTSIITDKPLPGVTGMGNGTLAEAPVSLGRDRREPRARVWELPHASGSVPRARRLATRQLNTWGLTEHAFATELIISELVTNAFRHATGPIVLRLIHDGGLICEVSDSNPCSPQPCRATGADDGGRGLQLVSDLADRWGTRRTRAGKTVWTEQRVQGPDL